MRGRRNIRVAATSISPVAVSPPKLSGAAKSAEASLVFSAHSLIIPGAPNRDAAETNTEDEAIFEDFFRATQRHYYVSAEESIRSHLLAGEEVAFTNLIIEALQARAELLAGDEAAELVIRAARERAEQRRVMMEEIEKEVALRMHDQRTAELLAIEFEALLPAHAAGCERIRCEETTDLSELFRWEKEYRPLGAGCFIKAPEVDRRLTSARRRTSKPPFPGSRLPLVRGSGRALSVRSSREYLAQLRQKSASSRFSGAALCPLATTTTGAAATPGPLLDGTLLATDEALFEEEGRARLQAERNRRHAELCEQRQVKDLQKTAADARECVLAEESTCWMQITRLIVDGIYAAQEATRSREKREAVEGAAAAQRATQKQAVKERLLRQRGLSVPKSNEGEGDVASVERQVTRESTEEGAHLPKQQAAAPDSAALAQPRRGSSTSTVPDVFSPTSASLVNHSSGALPESENTPGEAYVVVGHDLAHLRLIAGEITDQNACKELTALTKRETETELGGEVEGEVDLCGGR
ncbi:conserved hypothetical protein [Leishmania braziliensis MHOM/BR/75/M2904]|uniref:Uncharacterized protein n=2 Tax=Viannia TaxID=37616 RepID=A4HKG3_LEIBR|nr:conserved hypothetical protein [Leishmania braziliensis MHOM/BR/75/M2904]CAJ2478637.1 unnamed protein product [Leishmania braziliensis]CAM42988.1 conserved hypothetical protein [Leishmania braziliensis MHOM/BR/75/M2904]